MFRSRAYLWLFPGLLASALAVSAQVEQPPESAPGAAYTLHANARSVLTDVTVTDTEGNPVPDLPQSAFHIFDREHEEQIASFEEHTGASNASPSTVPRAPHNFSNDFLSHPPPAFDVMVLDTATINIVDQMYLFERLKHFVGTLPAGQLLAIYVHTGEYTIPLQDFSSDHALLLSALHDAIPVLRQPGAEYYSELQGLQRLSEYLAPYPGRKNVIWFSGDPQQLFGFAQDPNLNPGALRLLYDHLDSQRIALYPVDVRGPGLGDHIQMEQDARATGGRAYFNTNALARVAEKIVRTGSDFYTITYSPQDSRPDSKWHAIKVKVDGGQYHLSYRSGYYDDGTSDLQAPARPRTLLRAGGEEVHLPANRTEPIIFHVDAEPSSSIAPPVTPVSDAVAPEAKKGARAYTFRYTVPAQDFNVQKIGFGQLLRIGAAIVVLNGYGRLVEHVTQDFTLTFNGNKLTASPNAVVSFDQSINLSQGDDHVLVAVWDLQTGRLGTIQMPLQVNLAR